MSVWRSPSRAVAVLKSPPITSRGGRAPWAQAFIRKWGRGGHAHAHEALDRAVAAPHGWSDYAPAMPDDERLRRLFALNLTRGGGH